MSVYLIDFENVHDAGLKGIELLNSDPVHLFYTVNAGKISLDVFEDCRRANVILHKVPAGKQSLDILLSSYLGFLLSGSENERFVIISKDRDFDPVVEFWNSNLKNGCRVCRRHMIQNDLTSSKAASAEANAAEEPEEELAGPAPAEPEDKPAAEEAAEESFEEVLETAQEIASIIAEEAEEPAPEAEAQISEEPESAPEAEAQSAEEARPAEEAKPAEPRKRSSRRPERVSRGENKGNDIVAINNAVQKLLAANKVDTAKISFVSSLTAKTYGKPNCRQTIYRAIIKQFGQKEGLQLYGIIKSVL